MGVASGVARGNTGRYSGTPSHSSQAFSTQELDSNRLHEAVHSINQPTPGSTCFVNQVTLHLEGVNLLYHGLDIAAPEGHIVHFLVLAQA